MDITTTTLEVPGAALTYDVRPGDPPNAHRPLLMIGSPMGAEGFTTLASHFTDRRVVTYDPRGVGGPFDVFASSGGAVNALAWVATHPDDVAILVAHEPPIASVLPDAEAMKAAMLANRDA